LRQKLRENDFDQRQLQEAHRLVYHKALADIISMVKHAAREQEPILTADERVSRAMTRITEAHTFTDEQEKWLGLIRQHLIEHLTIDEDDFDNMPIFELHGGKPRARRVFQDQFSRLLEELNLAIAA
jgi:type I restriction enzyme, R subunit